MTKTSTLPNKNITWHCRKTVITHVSLFHLQNTNNKVTGALATRGIKPFICFFFSSCLSSILLVGCLYKIRYLRHRFFSVLKRHWKQQAHSHNWIEKSVLLLLGGQISGSISWPLAKCDLRVGASVAFLQKVILHLRRIWLLTRKKCSARCVWCWGGVGCGGRYNYKRFSCFQEEWRTLCLLSRLI